MTTHRGEHRARGTATTPMDYVGRHRPEVIKARQDAETITGEVLQPSGAGHPTDAWITDPGETP